MWMAAGCTTAAPAQGTDRGAPGESPEETPPAVPAGAETLVDLARADLAGQLGEKAGEVALLSVERTEFRDASLGVPEPGRMYAQVITPGYVIRLGVGDTVYTYHGSGDRVVLAVED
jgi:hypothetical protein